MTGAAVAPLITGIVGKAAGSLLAGAFQPDTPTVAAPPPTPTPAVTPVAPKPVVEKAVAEPVIDQEAAKIRARKRRTQTKQSSLLSLSEESEEDSLTRSLLGD
jgi:hypothetical protein